ncbi:hypothetical protein PFFVO_00743 [Plasmodium falciparum Vietnam Oak-Knoll (FVO)]|uniref:Uncharacterized protein n=1 Tax=Plasmodium falciparum Vietnam Oak-Knoll (FVO) TaxID=1036723 RepID=A0A024VCF8_PLAFA|nr:hypothetical protein PFFVO_00743 [Plasmodium falciparum Vietnam Oak-Knoll (FVO)]
MCKRIVVKGFFNIDYKCFMYGILIIYSYVVIVSMNIKYVTQNIIYIIIKGKIHNIYENFCI